MAQYTAELNEVVQIENGELVTFFDELLASYELFNPTYRDTLNMKIVKHYYFHEIGFETAERFVFEVNRKMDEIMVKYNQLYKSQIDINPLVNFRKLTNIAETSDDKENETINSTIDNSENENINIVGSDSESEVLNTVGTRNDELQNDTSANRDMSKSTSGTQDTLNENDLTNTGKVKDVKSDTPTSLILDGEIEGDVYASEASVNDTTNATNQTTTQNIAENQIEDTNEKDSTTQTQSTTSDLTSDTSKVNDRLSNNDTTRIKDGNVTNDSSRDNKKSSSRNQYINDEGITISESELLMRYRETFLNIDLDIINELRTMFMLIV